MTKSILFCSIVIATSLGASAQAAGNADNGKTLHDKNCSGCHKSEVYTRPDHKVKSLTALNDRIKFCESANKLAWTDQNIQDVAAYLDREFYKFKAK